ncbi:unnamed protein product [Gongylonema pulchrum]|uniref:Lipoyl-binding domain-containing protein n=1 Tax=Gongylonema pulchrum TaxID=637853 RepID=A0A183EN45_9BILA|nr:unnamed protein product [Gongylonema pulchrum]
MVNLLVPGKHLPALVRITRPISLLRAGEDPSRTSRPAPPLLADVPAQLRTVRIRMDVAEGEVVNVDAVVQVL